jgi:mRNA-degrading endonuclease RelE of RelBE toxin-antitoxin system
MPSETVVPVNVRFTPEFKRNLRALSRKYRHIRSDVEPIIERIQTGNLIGDRISGTGHVIFKVRVPNRDLPKGKRSGYRMIYYLHTPKEVILVTIYSKSEQSDISADQIRRILVE